MTSKESLNHKHQLFSLRSITRRVFSPPRFFLSTKFYSANVRIENGKRFYNGVAGGVVVVVVSLLSSSISEAGVAR
jgi:hypothetical protein